jgi:hypothetical protein
MKNAASGCNATEEASMELLGALGDPIDKWCPKEDAQNDCQVDSLRDCFENIFTAFQPALQPLIDYIDEYENNGEGSSNANILRHLRDLNAVKLISFFSLSDDDLRQLDTDAGCM